MAADDAGKVKAGGQTIAFGRRQQLVVAGTGTRRRLGLGRGHLGQGLQGAAATEEHTSLALIEERRDGVRGVKIGQTGAVAKAHSVRGRQVGHAHGRR